jgi:hypothetical protein
MTEASRSFDRLAFLVRIIVITALATWLLIERLHKHDGIGAAFVIAIGYVIAPALAYLYTRYGNSRLAARIVETVRGQIAGRKHDG